MYGALVACDLCMFLNSFKHILRRLQQEIRYLGGTFHTMYKVMSFNIQPKLTLK